MEAKMMVEIDHDELDEMIVRKYETRTPLFVWGAPGIGKSDQVRVAAKRIADRRNMKITEDPEESDKFRIIDKRLAQMDASEIKGLPNLDGKKTIWTKPSWFPTEGSGIIFFDELNLAPPIVQAAAYEIILDRRLGEYKLPDGFIVVGCGNRAEDRANTFEMPKPLLNRFTHVQLRPPSIDRWTTWALDHDVDSRIVTFLQERPGMLFKFDASDRSKSFPTPRSVSMAASEIKGIPTEGNLSTIKRYVGSAVGLGWASEFTSWLKLQEKVNMKQILKNPLKAELPNRADLCYAVCSGVVEYYDTKSPKQGIKVAAQLATRMDAEYGTLMLRMIKKKDEKTFIKEVQKLKEWPQLAKEYRKYLISEE